MINLFSTSKEFGIVFWSARRINVFIAFVTCFFISGMINAQENQVSAAVDSSRIRIGEQINYRLTVETNTGDLVVFPESQSFAPMEVVESMEPDTTLMQGRYRLLKIYSLTKFDSGSYTIPPQRVLINESPYYTDSLQVEVATVAVDTAAQKMFSIKPAMAVPASREFPLWIWWLLGIVALGAAVYYFLSRRKRKQEAAKLLPPYERALFELQQLDQSALLENRQTKEYYSRLTDAVRRYLEDEVHLRAMESTSSELIQYLEQKKNAGELNLSERTVADLKLTLQRADLAKFANSNPDIITAKQDRSRIEHVIKDTKAAIPEPDEEELLRDETYRELQVQKKRRRKIAVGLAAGILVLLLSTTALVAVFGYTGARDLVFGSSTKEMLKGEWIQSEYGDPAVAVTTPDVLKRGEIDLPKEVSQMLLGNETFIGGDLREELYVVLSTLKFREGVKFDLGQAVEGVYSSLEQKGARNIIMKEEEYSTLQGARGIKVFGSMELTDAENNYTENKKYVILNFAEKGGFQQLTVIYDMEDPYAEEIAGRIINSVEFPNTVN